jgi:hypothetical protein
VRQLKLFGGETCSGEPGEVPGLCEGDVMAMAVGFEFVMIGEEVAEWPVVERAHG